MALIPCKECNALISDKAKSCPKCGAPVTPSETIPCFECGTELARGTQVCPNCGAEQEVQAVAGDPLKDSAQAPSPRNKIILWSLFVLGTIFLITYLIAKKNKNEGPAAADDPAVANAYTPPPPPKKKTPEELKQEILVKERSNFLNYLSVEYNFDIKVRLLKKDEGIIKGSLTNSATLATFKDIVLSIKFLSNTDALLDTKPYTIYEFLPPGSTKPFELKGIAPPDTKKVEIQIISAGTN